MAIFAERSLALAYAEDGDLRGAERALTALVERLERDATGASAADLARVLCDRGSVRSWSVRPADALHDLERALSLSDGLRPISRHAIRISALDSMVSLVGAPHSPLHDPTRADVALAGLRSELTSAGERWIGDVAELRLAQHRQDWERVTGLSPWVITAFEAKGLPRGVAAVQNQLARALLQLGRAGDAYPHALAAWNFFREPGPPDIAAQAAISLARARALPADEESWRLIEDGLSRIESLVRSQRSLFDQQRYLVEKSRLYDDALRFALGAAAVDRDPTTIARAWEIAERAKSFSLRQAMTQGGWLHAIDPDIAEKLRTLDEQIDALEVQQGESDERAARQQVLWTERQSLLERAMLAAPDAIAPAPPPFSLDSTLAALGDGVGAISWYWLQEGNGWALHVFHAGTDRMARHAVSMWTRDKVARLDAARRETRTQPPFFVEPLLPPSLGDAVFPPSVIAALDGCHTVLATPHRALRLLPLHAAQLSSAAGTGWLFDHLALQLLPTLALPFPEDNAGTIGDVLLLGCVRDGFGHPELAEVEPEITDIASIWRHAGIPTRMRALAPAESLDGDVALSEWPACDVIHLACHGSFDPGSPLDATIFLGRDSVRAFDFFGISLRARLVCFSACDVGQQAEAIEGMSLSSGEWLGLALPLFQARAKTLLSSLWEANSEVAYEFMKSVHTSLARGASPAIAVQLACREQVALDCPYGLWANWQLAGFPR